MPQNCTEFEESVRLHSRNSWSQFYFEKKLSNSSEGALLVKEEFWKLRTRRSTQFVGKERMLSQILPVTLSPE